MTTSRARRQATTPVGFEKRLGNMGFDGLNDPRDISRITHELPAVLKLIIISIASGAPSAHGAERRSRQLKPPRAKSIALQSPVADNTISTLVPRLRPVDLRDCNTALIKAEKRRGNLSPSGGLNFHVVAIDGKCLMVWRWAELVRLTRLGWRALYEANPDVIIAPPFDIEERDPNEFEVNCLFKFVYYDVQLCFPKDGLPYGRTMVHRATLVSTSAAVVLMQRAILGSTNETGMLEHTLLSLLADFGSTDLCEMFVMDAGNTSLKAANWLQLRRRSYFMTLKTNHGHLHAEAVAQLGDADHDLRRPDLVIKDHRGGKDVSYRVWQHELEAGFEGWTHARQLVRVERIVVGDADGDVTTGNRYYVSDKSTKELKPSVALRLSRAYWRCENEGHWTADVILEEDKLKGRLSRHPVGVVVAGWLRLMAYNILAVLRSLSRTGTTKAKPPWAAVIEYVLLAFCENELDTAEFDAVKA